MVRNKQQVVRSGAAAPPSDELPTPGSILQTRFGQIALPEIGTAKNQ
jgi:hypothetical protein